MDKIIEIEISISYIQKQKQELRDGDCMLFPVFVQFYKELSSEEKRLRKRRLSLLGTTKGRMN